MCESESKITSLVYSVLFPSLTVAEPVDKWRGEEREREREKCERVSDRSQDSTWLVFPLRCLQFWRRWWQKRVTSSPFSFSVHLHWRSSGEWSRIHHRATRLEKVSLVNSSGRRRKAEKNHFIYFELIDDSLDRRVRAVKLLLLSKNVWPKREQLTRRSFHTFPFSSLSLFPMPFMEWLKAG